MAIVRYIITFVLVAHGIAHVPGFAVSFGLMNSPDVPYHTALLAGRFDIGQPGMRVVGVLWLLIGLAFVLLAVLFLFRWSTAPVLIGGVVIASLVLCGLEWPYARVGLFLNFGLLVALPLLGHVNWREAIGRMDAEMQSAPAGNGSVTPQDPEVPPPVARYFRRAFAEGRAAIRRAVLTQDAEILVNGAWKHLRATQRFAVAPPGFVWDAHIEMAPLMPIDVRDAYVNGHGSMHAEMAGLYQLVHQTNNAALDFGALHRYLAEAVWFPTALLPSSGVRWEPIDDRSARATLTDAHTTVSLEFHFNADDDVVEIFTPARYAEDRGGYVPRPWRVRCSNHATVGGIRIPTFCSVEWQLPAGAQPYWRGRVVEAHYDFD